MVIAEPGWLHTLGQMAGTLLLIELVLVLLVVCALVIAIAYAAWWLRGRVVPIVDQYGGEAQRLLGVAQHGTDRVAHGVAEFHGRWEGIRTAIRALIFGRSAMEREAAMAIGATVRPASADQPGALEAALPAPRQVAPGEPVAGIDANGHNASESRYAG
ncbi:MAG TPA: hypothetical protein VGP82_20070 [Ktedonobacterales bacterium]|jgi:hypothetical protein|nr:hypothetical protein [Ktedonobacterales bacterium]